MFDEYPALFFLRSLPLTQRRLDKAVKMLQQDQVSLFGHITNDTIYSVVKSQTDWSLTYACWLRADGTYACHTQNLRTCGGLQETLCKHIIVILGQFSHYPELREIIRDWVGKAIGTRSQNRKMDNTKYIFEQYIDSTGSALNVNENVDASAFEQITGDYIYYEPEIIDYINLEPDGEQLDQRTHRRFQETIPPPERVPRRRPEPEVPVQRREVREGKVAIISVCDKESRNRPLLELHQKVDEKITSTASLDLRYVMCIADRKREKLEISKEKEWKKCKLCDNWICIDCFGLFQTQTNQCVGGMFGFEMHKISI